MNITDETIEYLSKLAKLEFNEIEKSKVKKDFEKVVAYVNIMNEVDTEGVAPLSHVFDIKNVFREDLLVKSEEAENLLKNAPSKKNGYYKVPKTIE